MSDQALPLIQLTEQFASLPGIGMKTAGRLAYHMLTLSEEEIKRFTDAVTQAHKKIKHCDICQNFTDQSLCEVCADPSRDDSVLCVVESPKDVMAFERTREYRGRYHVLHGLISPMDGIGPDDIYIKQLLTRIGTTDTIKEVILATDPTVEGEATAMYLLRLLKPMGVSVSRLAFGIPVGSSLEYADEVTLFKALENRSPL